MYLRNSRAFDFGRGSPLSKYDHVSYHALTEMTTASAHAAEHLPSPTGGERGLRLRFDVPRLRRKGTPCTTVSVAMCACALASYRRGSITRVRVIVLLYRFTISWILCLLSCVTLMVSILPGVVRCIVWSRKCRFDCCSYFSP